MDQAEQHAEQCVLHERDASLHRDPRRYRRNGVLARLPQDDVRREKAAERPGELDAVPHRVATALERGEEQGEEDALDQHRPEPHGDDRLRAHDGDRSVVGGEDGEMGRALHAERDYHVGEDRQTDGGRLAGFHGGLSGAFIMQVTYRWIARPADNHGDDAEDEEAHVTDRAALLRRGARLEGVTVVYNTLEGVVAVVAGLAAGSVALTGFGIDSVIEVASGVVLWWRLRAELSAARVGPAVEGAGGPLGRRPAPRPRGLHRGRVGA